MTENLAGGAPGRGRPPRGGLSPPPGAGWVLSCYLLLRDRVAGKLQKAALLLLPPPLRQPLRSSSSRVYLQCMKLAWL